MTVLFFGCLLFGCDSSENNAPDPGLENLPWMEPSSTVPAEDQVAEVENGGDPGSRCWTSSMWSDARTEVERIALTGMIAEDTGESLFFIDFIVGGREQVWSVVCPTTVIDVALPRDLGSVQLAVFADTDESGGPSKGDRQVGIGPITIGTDTTTDLTFSLSEEPISWFRFDPHEGQDAEMLSPVDAAGTPPSGEEGAGEPQALPAEDGPSLDGGETVPSLPEGSPPSGAE